MTAPMRNALVPLRDGVIARAQREADAELRVARREAETLIAEAREASSAAVDKAVARGREDAAAARSAEEARRRRSERAVELAAQREAFEELIGEVTARLSQLDDQALRDRLRGRVRSALGSEAEVVDAPGGGVIGRVPGRLVDLSFRTAAARAVEELGADVERLWTP
ncbi:hypothetical protein [Saccharopolyspora sp. NPDC002686]|uniref:hypothetical protein n=1 Tax=Saccharopolyspora sp. NPDC002686 TaxID=3154541 RepID=UPI00332465A8